MPIRYRIEKICFIYFFKYQNNRLAAFQNQKLLNAKIFQNQRTRRLFIKQIPKSQITGNAFFHKTVVW